MLLNTGTEEIGHIEMLSTAVALNLEGAPLSVREDVSKDAVGGSVLNGMSMQHILSSGLAAMPVNSDGVPFDCSHIYASGNIAADMTANVTAESTGRTLATRLYNMTDDPGMKDMLAFLIARDTMHQQQWMAVIEELGGTTRQFPIPNSFPQEKENREFSYVYLGHMADGSIPQGRWSSGPSLDGNAQFTAAVSQPLGEKPALAPARPDSGAQAEQTSKSGASGVLGAVEGAIERNI
jgi:Mn-containing catalase